MYTLEMKKKLVGKRILVVSGKYYRGLEGKIFYCKTCCRAYRVQFDNIANNIKLKELGRNNIKFI